MIVEYAALRQVLKGAERPPAMSQPGYERDSVCLLLVDRAETALLAIQKTDSAGYYWRGQVALPGGRIEATDRSAADAALRELHEELGIERSEVEILGQLGHFQTVDSRNDLDVFIGRWARPGEIHSNDREVARVLEVSLSQLIESHLGLGFRSRPASQIGDDLIYPVPDAEIWGVTARILHHFVELVLDQENKVLKR